MSVVYYTAPTEILRNVHFSQVAFVQQKQPARP